MENSASYEGVNAALSALIYDIYDVSGRTGNDFSGMTLNEILDGLTRAMTDPNESDIRHDELRRRIVAANGLGDVKLLNTSWQSGGKYGSMNAATFEVDGKLFVAYRGTGDGNWIYNADSAYGYEASDMQKWAAQYFDDVMDKMHHGQEVYVTGHSQGGNNAMYVTLFSEYRQYITNYVSFDGPGFSKDVLEQAKYLNGKEAYESIRQKGYAVNGHEDFVHNLGEEHATPEDHIKYVEARMDSVMGTHDLYSHFKEDGTLGNPYGEGAISRLMTELNQRMVEQLSKEERYQLGQAVMKVVENLNPSTDTATIEMGPEDVERLKLLIPILTQTMEEQPGLFEAALREAGIPVAYADMVCTIINEFNQLSPELRNEALEMLVGCIEVKADGSLTFDPSQLDGWTTIAAAVPLILETLAHHPTQIAAVLSELGLDKKIGEWLSERPAVAVALVLLAPALMRLVVKAEAAIMLIDALYHIVEGVVGAAKKVVDFVLNALSAIKEAIGRLKEWLKKKWNERGASYAAANPHFRVDTGLLRSYAERIATVNRRLKQLDWDLNSLYWQVGLLDIWDILVANLITSESWTLWRVECFLNEAADRFEYAEAKACQYMGG